MPPKVKKTAAGKAPAAKKKAAPSKLAKGPSVEPAVVEPAVVEPVVEQPSLPLGPVTLKYSHYTDEFELKPGALLLAKDIVEEYALESAFENGFDLSLEDEETGGTVTQTTSKNSKTKSPAAFTGLSAGRVYLLRIVDHDTAQSQAYVAGAAAAGAGGGAGDDREDEITEHLKTLTAEQLKEGVHMDLVAQRDLADAGFS
jgi:hypothetical protein